MLHEIIFLATFHLKRCFKCSEIAIEIAFEQNMTDTINIVNLWK